VIYKLCSFSKDNLAKHFRVPLTNIFSSSSKMKFTYALVVAVLGLSVSAAPAPNQENRKLSESKL
jgi:hypothetical protein